MRGKNRNNVCIHNETWAYGTVLIMGYLNTNTVSIFIIINLENHCGVKKILYCYRRILSFREGSVSSYKCNQCHRIRYVFISQCYFNETFTELNVKHFANGHPFLRNFNHTN